MDAIANNILEQDSGTIRRIELDVVECHYCDEGKQGKFVAKSAEVFEEERLDALRELKVLDTESNPAIDAVVVAAAKLLDVPIALVSLVDKNRQWFKANYGLDGVTETDRSIAFCDHAIRDHGVFCVENAQIDPDFCDNPLVTGSPDVRFYAGGAVTSSKWRPGGDIVRY